MTHQNRIRNFLIPGLHLHIVMWSIISGNHKHLRIRPKNVIAVAPVSDDTQATMSEDTISDVPALHESSYDRFYRIIREQEVPLNYFLNIFLRLSSRSVRQSLLAVFGLDAHSKLFAGLEFRHPNDLSFIQPDVVLESAQARVFIEVKVKAKIEIEQIQKYCLLHLHYNRITNQSKAPFLIFITHKEFSKHWSPASEIKAVTPFVVEDFLRQKLIAQPFTPKLEQNKAAMNYQADYPELLANIKFGAATWQSFGDAIQKQLIAKQFDNDEAAEMFEVLAGDFLADLKERLLWKP